MTPRVSYGRCHPALARRSGELGRNQQNRHGDHTATSWSTTTVSLSPTGKAWLLSYEAGRVGDWSGSGKSVAGDVFTAHSSANPKLLNGNKFCATPATYVVIWSPGEGELAINAYSGSKAPTGTDGLCASYFYQTPKDGRSAKWTWRDIRLDAHCDDQPPMLRSC